ncbi:hypothetical protein QWA68_008560 [Fusarium oxysporum]|nr:hypothetical protein QWA68_008560 [Fusarium oxysporum]
MPDNTRLDFYPSDLVTITRKDHLQPTTNMATPDHRSQTENVQQLSVSTYRISKTHIGCTGTHTRVQDRDLQIVSYCTYLRICLGTHCSL